MSGYLDTDIEVFHLRPLMHVGLSRVELEVDDYAMRVSSADKLQHCIHEPPSNRISVHASREV